MTKKCFLKEKQKTDLQAAQVKEALTESQVVAEFILNGAKGKNRFRIENERAFKKHGWYPSLGIEKSVFTEDVGGVTT